MVSVGSLDTRNRALWYLMDKYWFLVERTWGDKGTCSACPILENNQISHYSFYYCCCKLHWNTSTTFFIDALYLTTLEPVNSSSAKFILPRQNFSPLGSLSLRLFLAMDLTNHCPIKQVYKYFNNILHLVFLSVKVSASSASTNKMFLNLRQRFSWYHLHHAC